MRLEAGNKISEIAVQCGCGRQMRLDPLRGKGAFRCGCGLAVVVAVKPQITRPASRCVAPGPGPDGLCIEATCAHPGFETICEKHYQRLVDRISASLEADLAKADSDELSLRRYAAFFAQTERDWPLTTEETYASLAQRDSADTDTTLDRPQWLVRAAAGKPVHPVVYYVRNGDMVKIGTSIDAARRVQHLALPPEALLATEPGGRRREKELHDYWAPVRAHGEWFHAVPALLAYIEEVKAKQSAPRAA